MVFQGDIVTQGVCCLFMILAILFIKKASYKEADTQFHSPLSDHPYAAHKRYAFVLRILL